MSRRKRYTEEELREKKREYMREYRKRNPEYVRNWFAEHPEKVREYSRRGAAKRRESGAAATYNVEYRRRRLDEDADGWRRSQRAWKRVHREMQPKPCDVCGQENGVHAHHEDYERPLDVRWLCPLHHKEAHRV